MLADSGVARFHPRRPGTQFESFSLAGTPEAQFVNTLAEDRDGSLLAGTNGGLFRIARGTQIRIEPVRVEIERYPGALSILQVRVDSNGEWWVGTEKGLLRRARNGAWLWLTTQQGLPSDFIGAIAIDAHGRVWAGTKGGAARLRSDKIDLVLTERNGLPDGDVRAIRFVRGGKAWIGTMNGLAEWDSETGRVVRSYHRGDGLADESVYAIAEDPAGNLWFGTRRGGLLQLLQSEIQTYGAAAGLASSGDDVLLETVGGEICAAAIGDPRRPLECLESGRFVRVVPRLPPSVAAAPITSSQATLQDHTGAWWISTGKGLLRFPPAASGRLLANRNHDLWLLRDLECRRLLEDKAGNIWVETKEGKRSGLAKWDASERRIIDLSARLPERARTDSISALAESGSDIWLGLGRPGGLFRLHGETNDEIPGIPRGTVNALHYDRRGHIWVATSDAGLAEVDRSGARPVIHIYDVQSHLSSNEVWCITEDRLGRVYAGMARGVDRIEPGAGAVLHYSVEDGLAEGDIRSALCDRNGDLWFLSNRGLSRLRFAAEPAPAPPIPRISELGAGGKLELFSEFGETQAGPLRLDPDQSSVDIDFLAVTHRAPWRLRYQLQGAGHTSWSEPSSAPRFASHIWPRLRTVSRSVASARPDNSVLPPSWSFSCCRRSGGAAGLLRRYSC